MSAEKTITLHLTELELGWLLLTITNDIGALRATAPLYAWRDPVGKRLDAHERALYAVLLQLTRGSEAEEEAQP